MGVFVCDCDKDQAVGNDTCGGLADTPTVLSTKLPSVNFGIRLVPNDYYVVAKRLDSFAVPVEDFVHITSDDTEFVYYDKQLSLTTESSVMPYPEAPGYDLQDMGGGTWRLYLDSTKQFYIQINRTVESEDISKIVCKFNMNLVGYDLSTSNPFDIVVGFVSGQAKADISVELPEPFLTVSTNQIWLAESNKYTEFVDLKSNLS